jgi:site-specific recombinase XerD
MLTRGVPLKVVSDILGHLSVAITGDIYGHVSPDVACQAMDTLGDAFDRAQTAPPGSP